MQKKLPGAAFHKQMMPLHSIPIRPSGKKPVQAAVSVILYNVNKNDFEILLIKRAEYKGYHSGQISFPGGKADKKDTSLIDTAIRETYEEIGIKLKENECISILTPLIIPISGFEVTPFVFFIEKPDEFILDKKEVKYIIYCKVSELLSTEVIKKVRLTIDERKLLAPCYNISGEIVWGATSMILAEFAEILRRIKSKNPGLV